MQLSNESQAVMLLTVPFGKSGDAGDKPLSANEWGRLATWLEGHDLQPSSLLKGDLSSLLIEWNDRKVTSPRLESLLGRGLALGLALEKWHRAGLWVITRSDPDYPECLKQKLKFQSPPVLFGCGEGKLLKKGGIAVVGSRNATDDDMSFASGFGAEIAAQGRSVISGGARGIDQQAMMGALEHEGTAVGVLADSLMRSATSAKHLKYITSGDLVLVSPFSPEAGFNVGNAMGRNRYIYCLSDAAVAVSSTPNKGGTWNGAIENLKEGWVSLWLKRSDDEKSGNSELVAQGGNWLPEDLSNLAELIKKDSGKSLSMNQQYEFSRGQCGKNAHEQGALFGDE